MNFPYRSLSQYANSSLKVDQVMNGFKWAKDTVFQLDTQKISAKTTFSL